MKKLKLKRQKPTVEMDDWDDIPVPNPIKGLVSGKEWDEIKKPQGTRDSLRKLSKGSSMGSTQPNLPEVGRRRYSESLTKTKSKVPETRENIQVTIDAATGNLKIGDLLMEVVTLRRTIPDWDIQKWANWVEEVGSVPMKYLAKDHDRYHMMIYAIEFVHRNASEAQLKESRKHAPKLTNDISQHQDKLDGKMWGGTDDDVLTVRGQMEASKAANLEANREAVAPAPYVPPADDQYVLKWKLAEKRATEVPRDQWEGQVDTEFERMVKACYTWLKEIGSVPDKPFEYQDLFWPRPLVINQGEEALKRRTAITNKIIKFMQKSVAEAGDTLDMEHRSYRTVLAAQKLERLIEKYANNYKRKNPLDEVELKGQIRDAATEYFQAHFPVTDFGAKPGPISTLDPDYPEYLRLCRQYKLEEGILLHEADL